MVCRLMDFAYVFLKLLMFKLCGITGISKIEFLNFFCTVRVKQNQWKIKNHSKPPNLLIQSLLQQFHQISNIFFCGVGVGGIIKNLTHLLHVSCYVGDNIGVHSDSNLLKPVRVNFAWQIVFWKIKFLMLSRLIYLALVVLKLVLFKVFAMCNLSNLVFQFFLNLMS